MPSWIKGARIAIWGYGAEGCAVHKFLRDAGGYKSLSVLTPEPVKLDGGAENFCGDQAMDMLRDGAFDIVVKSPGISLYDPVIAAAKKSGTVFTSATNIWFEQYPDAKTIVVTGTKGKSTTASLLHHILKKAGLDVELGGNIGTPLITLTPGKDFTVIELSSYQLADLTFVPDIYVVLNLYPEHLPWHGDVDHYYRDKLSPALKFDDDLCVIANDESATLHEYLDGIEGVCWFNTKTINSDVTLPLKGNHNRSNFAAICAVLQAIDLDCDAARLCSDYKALPHRMQEVAYNGVLFVNDSISTTPQSTLQAIETYKDHPLTLIMGGTDRGQVYDDFVRQICDLNVQHIYILPGHSERLVQAIDVYGGDEINYTNVDDLEIAMQMIGNTVTHNDVVLLSPAAPSFTQFTNFEERGEDFMNLARHISLNTK